MNHKFLFSFFSFLGNVIIVLVAAVALLLITPRFFQMELFNVVSGSMEPAIPVGSLIGVKYENPAEIEDQDIIAFYHQNSIVTHRVIENDVQKQEFITKGDANDQKDMNGISYSHFIGKVVFTIPIMGFVAAMLSTLQGKIYLMLLAGVGILFKAAANHLKKVKE